MLLLNSVFIIEACVFCGYSVIYVLWLKNIMCMFSVFYE